MNFREIGWEVVGWLHLAQDMDHWRALVVTLGFYKRREISWLAEFLLASQEGLYSTDLGSNSL